MEPNQAISLDDKSVEAQAPITTEAEEILAEEVTMLLGCHHPETNAS
jgi:hypothetical protein